MNFDGVDDYIDLGDSVANGVRTIEMWFQPKTTIDSSISDFSYLTVREIATVNTNEFNIKFNKSSVSDAGALGFVVRDANNTANFVESNSTKWNKDQWYHLAAVIDPIKGMMMFIDGVKQTDTNSSTIAITSIKNATTIGGTSSFPNRYFHGYMDDVRFSTSAEYSTNFTPPCSDLKASASTVGLWNFNDSSNAVVAVDSSGNKNDADIFGATRDTATYCKTIITSINDYFSTTESISVYPNPSSGRFTFKIQEDLFDKNRMSLIIYDFSGKLVKEQMISSNKQSVNLENLANGFFFYRLVKNGDEVHSGKLIKH